MAKYGINQFVNGDLRKFIVDPVSRLGKIYFGGVEVQEHFYYLNEETGEKFEDQNTRGTLKAVNTHEIEKKWVMVVSDKFNEALEVQVPVDFDESEFSHLEEIHLTGKVTSSPYASSFETVLPNGNNRSVPKITFTLATEGVGHGSSQLKEKASKPQEKGADKPKPSTETK